MPRRHDHRVPRNDDKAVVREVKQPAKLLDFVMQTLDGISRNKAKSILVHGGVTVDDRVQSHVDYPLDEGSIVKIRRHARPSSVNNKNYRIVYEDRWIVVVDKQQGVLSMPVGAGSLNMKTLLDRHFTARSSPMSAASPSTNTPTTRAASPRARRLASLKSTSPARTSIVEAETSALRRRQRRR